MADSLFEEVDTIPLENDCQVKIFRIKREIADQYTIGGEAFEEMWRLHPAERDFYIHDGEKKFLPRYHKSWIKKGYDYNFTGMSKKNTTRAKTPDVVSIFTQIAQEIAGCEYQQCLLNFYDGGNDSIGKHADDEPEIDQAVPIVSISLGQTRTFNVWDGDVVVAEIEMEHGMILVMSAGFQSHYKHSVPKQRARRDRRINITYRALKPSSSHRAGTGAGASASAKPAESMAEYQMRMMKERSKSKN